LVVAGVFVRGRAGLVEGVFRLWVGVRLVVGGVAGGGGRGGGRVAGPAGHLPASAAVGLGFSAREWPGG
jgi:hypothetical protein